MMMNDDNHTLSRRPQRGPQPSSPTENSKQTIQQQLLEDEENCFKETLLLGASLLKQTELPVPPGPHIYNKENATQHLKQQQQPRIGCSFGELRSREDIVLHFLIELTMLRTDWALILFGLLFQWVHSVLTNVAYYYHAKLTAAQRVPLQDVSFEILPILKGDWWMVSEYIFYTMIAIFVGSIASILVTRWNAPHRRPLYCIPILRRGLMTLVAAQTLRCISFLVTTLPGMCLF